MLLAQFACDRFVFARWEQDSVQGRLRHPENLRKGYFSDQGTGSPHVILFKQARDARNRKIRPFCENHVPGPSQEEGNNPDGREKQRENFRVEPH